MTASPAPDPSIERIRAAAHHDAEQFGARLADSALEAAVDIWARRVAARTMTPDARRRLATAVARGTAAETRDIQLTRAALLRKAGLDERAAAAAAITAGASYTLVAAVLGMTQQGASARFGRHVVAAADTARRAQR